jgi:hypothetical protein
MSSTLMQLFRKMLDRFTYKLLMVKLSSFVEQLSFKVCLKKEPCEAVAVEARHGGHDYGGGRRGWSSHRQCRETIVVVCDAMVTLVMFSVMSVGTMLCRVARFVFL